MRSTFASLAAFGLFTFGLISDSSSQPAATKPEVAKDEKEADCSTLSELGIDFGAAELERFTELGLSEAQKKQALVVVRDRHEKIEELCGRMTEALALDEGSPKKKKAKEAALAEIVGEFRQVQERIITGLHAILTEDQMGKLVAMKKREAEAKEKAQRAKEATG